MSHRISLGEIAITKYTATLMFLIITRYQTKSKVFFLNIINKEKGCPFGTALSLIFKY